MHAKTSKYFVQKEDKNSLSIPKAWGTCYSLIHAPSGDINGVDAQWIGFFICKKTALKIKSLLDTE